MCAILQLVSAPLNPLPIAEHFRRSHPQCEHSYGQHLLEQALLIKREFRIRAYGHAVIHNLANFSVYLILYSSGESDLYRCCGCTKFVGENCRLR